MWFISCVANEDVSGIQSSLKEKEEAEAHVQKARGQEADNREK